MQTLVLVTGGFDPVHSGHLDYFTAARQLGDQLIVGLNSDQWLHRKKGRAFMPWHERVSVISNLVMVNKVCAFDDSDGSARSFIQQVRADHPEAKLIFANGGDRTDVNIPEMDVTDHNLEFAFAVGGTQKSNSSSWILQEWRAPSTPRPWGHYRVLHDTPGVKVKELTVEPGAALSMQRHKDRAEFWLVVAGTATVYTLDAATDAELLGRYGRHEYLHIGLHDWHQLVNEDPNPLKIVEIQYGDRCEESDIERSAT